MASKIIRAILNELKERIKFNPVVALLGPRQCGKTTLAKELLKETKNGIYLDLENPDDLPKISEPLVFLNNNKEKLIVIDEIQLKPALFGPLRSFIDSVERNCQILILGSASQNLIRQGSESLAGRISYLELTPLTIREAYKIPVNRQWERGGFPLSLLASTGKQSFIWRDDYLRALIERDLPILGLPGSPLQVRRLISMLAHSHGELFNGQKLGESLGITAKTLKSYVDFLEGAFIIRRLAPFEGNLKKRLVKSPKIYYRDSGLLHTILRINDFNDLLGHPVFGASWEGFVIEQILASIDNQWDSYFYRTQAGAEIDLILEKGELRIAIECKATTSPSVTRGFWTSLKDLSILPHNSWIISPIDDLYPYRDGVTIGGVTEIIKYLNNL